MAVRPYANLCIDIQHQAINITLMMELEEARERILAEIRILSPESVPLNTAAGRFLAEDVLSPIDLPYFDNSAMDGYALRAADLTTASAQSPASLQLVGRVPAGERLPTLVGAGTCVRVFTGSPLPTGADAVVMQEDTKIDPSTQNTVLVLDQVKPWENVRFKGEDIKVGATLAYTGQRLTPSQIALLGATGLDRTTVVRQPVVGLIATGSELAEPGARLAPGQIYESNRIALTSLLFNSGASPRIFPIIPDSVEATKAALLTAFSECDGVITTGGVSVGEFDFVKSCFEELGGKLDFWRVAIKPGKPFVFGRWGAKFLFGLPGNPVSAFVTFVLLVRPAILAWQGASQPTPSSTTGTLMEPLRNDGDRRHYMRVYANERGEVNVSGRQASHLLASLAAANGLVEVPPYKILEAGERVSVIRLDQ